MGMIVCFMTQCCLFFWNRYELPAVVLGLVDHPTRVDYLSSAGENGLITATHNILRHRLVTDESTIPAVASLSLSHSPTRDFQENGRPTSPNETPQHRNANLQHQPQSQRALHPTSSHGNFSVGRMSRASSEAIFRLAADGDDESESCMYFLGGEVVLRRGDSRGNRQGNSGSGSTNESFHLNRYDSASTIHSTGGLGTVADETEDSRSGLQAIHDLTPRLCNTYRTDSFEESPPAASSVPVFPVLAENDSTPPTRVLQRQSRTT